MKPLDLTGQIFGNLVVVKRVEDHVTCGGQKKKMYLCKCSCGNMKVIQSASLRNGRTKSCGCINLAKLKAGRTTHGMRKTRLYGEWAGMKTRCFNPNSQRFSDYGGRGITVCEEWKNDFKSFYDYVSQLPHFGEEGYSLDRINNDGNYEPGNVKWSTAKEQNFNQRRTAKVEFNGEIHTLAEWSDIKGIPLRTLKYRYYHGKRPDEILSKKDARKERKNGVKNQRISIA